jgi:hypothetical protein
MMPVKDDHRSDNDIRWQSEIKDSGKVVKDMKISKRAINVAVFTAVALMFVMVFGYTFRMFSEIKAMDLSGLDSDKMGIAATDMTEDSSKAEPGEADAVAKVETVMLNSVDARDMTASIRADYDNNRMVLLILSDGTEAAAKADDPAEWNKVIELGDTCSAEGEQILSRSGLEGWSFDVEILNDTCPQNALLTFADGECTYNARIAE